jgi:hypothetical protein
MLKAEVIAKLNALPEEAFPTAADGHHGGLPCLEVINIDFHPHKKETTLKIPPVIDMVILAVIVIPVMTWVVSSAMDGLFFLTAKIDKVIADRRAKKAEAAAKAKPETT